MKGILRILSTVFLIAASLWVPHGLTAERDDFADKTVFVYVGRPPGSGADLAVRSFVRYWQKHIPGQPTMVVKNVPGGGGSRVWNIAWDMKNPNALEIFFSPVSGTAIIVRQKGLRADLSKMPLLGALMSPNMTFARTDRLKTAEDLLNVKGLRLGGQAPVHRFSILGRLTLDILGVDYQSVTGYRGASDVFNAVRREEVDIQTAPLNFYRFTVEPSVVQSGDVIPLWYNPVINKKGEIVRLDAAGDIPSFIDYYRTVKGESPAGELFENYKWLLAHLNGITYAAFLAPGAESSRIEILRDSFTSVTRDQQFRTEEARMFGFNLPAVSTQEATAVIASMSDAPEHIRVFLDQYIQQGR